MLDDIFFTVVYFESLASQRSEKNSSRNALLVACPVVIVFGPFEETAGGSDSGHH
jgi:hypothetical protein